ncbi:transcription factor HIVEP3 [Lates calcarifer]|uniref:Transcription factor HIVEP3 n=1 Tax=Lates calcarifer TaxID=8187 RepID=A0AAJ8DX96_LATCA|nr:transcription factor HIVEP3 [Lates calcarifer]
MSTGLKLEIPLRHDDYSDIQVSHSHIQQSAPHITSSLELLRPVTSPSVAVRLQTDTLTPACAIYTTLSQSTSPRPQEAVDAVSHNVGISTPEYRNHRNISPDFESWSDDSLRLSGSGGNKRMLSPSNSIELPPESQQQQKRVKEEVEREVGCFDKASVDPSNQELKRENLADVCAPITHVGPSFPSLLSSTCNSWCYLNYIKPNPSTLDEQKPSVYSSWSTSSYDPNPPGLSSKTALSLLHCKQRLSPSIYTISPMSVRTTDTMEQEDNKRPCSTEVYNSQSYCRDREGTRNGQPSADDNRSNREEVKEEQKEEEVQSNSRNKQPPEVWISDQGSNEKYGGGGGKCQCEDCGFHHNNTSVLQKCTDCSTESPPCNITFKATGSLTEHLRSKPHGKETCCYPDDTDEGVCEDPSVHPDKQRDHQFSDLGKGGHDEDNNTKDKNDRHEDNRSISADSSHTASCDSEKPHSGGQPMEPEPSRSLAVTPNDSTQKNSARTRRALFARRRLDASASSRGSQSPSAQSLTPRREPSPPRSPSPRLTQSPAPPSSLSTSSCHVPTSPLRPVSPVRGLSPIIVQSHGFDFSGPLGSLADTSAQCQTCLHPRDRQSTARLSVDEVGLTHITPHPTRLRGAHNLLSHLPLHSQQPSRAPSLLIPIGGIHMIQPRSPLPLYSLVCSPTTATANPTGAGTSWRPSNALKGRFSLLQRQDTLKEMSPSSRASPTGPETSGETSPDSLSHRKSRGCFSIPATFESQDRGDAPRGEHRHTCYGEVCLP